MPKPRKYAGRVPREALELAAALKRESPRRAISTFIDILERSGQVERGTLKRSTVYDYFTRLGLTRPQQRPREVYRRYQAHHRNERWIGDVCHLTYFDDPENPPKIAGRTVTVRFDSCDASDVRVFLEGKGYGQARPLHEPQRHVGLKPSSGGPKEPTGLNLLTSAPKEGMS